MSSSPGTNSGTNNVRYHLMKTVNSKGENGKQKSVDIGAGIGS